MPANEWHDQLPAHNGDRSAETLEGLVGIALTLLDRVTEILS